MTAARSDDRLKGKAAIVTGAGSRGEGIGNGRATAVMLARHGARVTLVDNAAQWADETKRLIDAEGGISAATRSRVMSPFPQRVRRSSRAHGGSLGLGLDVLVNNVGIGWADAATPSRSMSAAWDSGDGASTSRR